MRQISDEGRREIAKELREQFFCCQYAEEFTEGLYDVLDLTKPNVISVTCPACGMSNSIAWGSMDLPPFRQAVAMLADSWNSR